LKASLGGAAAFSVAVLVLTFAPGANAAHIMVDSFDHPVAEAFFVPGVPPWGSGEPAAIQQPELPDPILDGIIGGQRDVLIDMVGDPLPISAAGMIGYEAVYNLGCLWIATFGDAGTCVVVQYDGLDDDPGDAILDAELLGGLDLTGGGTNYAIKLRFLQIDAGDGTALKLKVSVQGSGGSDSVEYDIPESSAPSTFSVPFSHFDAGLFTSVDSITFAFNDLPAPVSNVDFEVDSIAAVPEPSTFALLAIGALAVTVGWWRRRGRGA
jgi:hypothetical protein